MCDKGKTAGTVCNPLSLPYEFFVGKTLDADANETGEQFFFRESADPSVLNHDGRYWMTASKFHGYFYSDDLLRWTFVRSETLPVETVFYGPDLALVDGKFCWSGNSESAPFHLNPDPLKDEWAPTEEAFLLSDPKVFQDDDGRVYLYNIGSNIHPIVVCELERGTLARKTEDIPVHRHDRRRNGWERPGRNNDDEANLPWIEGAWMNKINGKYYFQYASPGTEFKVYSDAVLVSDSPRGPFVMQKSNPLSYKPGGFIHGAGHGCTFEDKHGNFWHMTGMGVHVLNWVERRIGLFPAGVDEEGILYCITRFGDYPQRIPGHKWVPWTDYFAGWMLQSANAKATASSSRGDCPPGNAVDESVQTWWCAERGDGNAWLALDLGRPARIKAVQVNFAEVDCSCVAPVELKGETRFLFAGWRQKVCEGIPANLNGSHKYTLEVSGDGANWTPIADKAENTEDVPHDYIELEDAVSARHVRLKILEMPGKGAPAVRGLRVFGDDGSGAPEPAKVKAVTRSEEDPCTVKLTWEKPDNADGCNILWGIAPDKLYNCRQTNGIEELEMHCLNAGTDYYIALEAFGRGGVARRSELCFIPTNDGKRD